MPRPLFIVLALVLSLRVFGSPPDPDLLMDAPGDDPFTTLDRLFEDARSVAPARSEATGNWAGRCFFHSDKSKAIASVLIGLESVKAGDPGPIFSPEKIFKLVVGYKADRPGELFEEVGPQGEAKLKAFVESSLGYVTTVVETNRSLQNDYISDAGLGVRYRVRRATASDGKSYLVAKATILRGHATLGEGDAQALCYYFAKTRVSAGIVDPGVTPDLQPYAALKPEPKPEPTPAPTPTPVVERPREPWCSCFCAGPARPIRVRAPGGGYAYEYRHVPLFGRDGYTQYHVSGYDAYSCMANNGRYCEGYENYPRDPNPTGFATGFHYGCRLAR